MMKHNRIMVIAYIIFLLMGVGMLVGGGWLVADTARFTSGAVKTDGKVVDLIGKESTDNSNHSHTLWYPVVEFKTPDGRMIQFESKSGSNPSMYGREQELSVIYRPDTPGNARINSVMELWFTPAMVFTFGLLFSIVGGGIGFAAISKKKKNEWLASNGIILRTEVKHIGHDTSMSINSTHPYRIISQYHDKNKNKVYIFESEPIWFDPSEFIENHQINVLADPANYNKYCMDLSFLPRQG